MEIINTSEKIISKIKQGDISEILKELCHSDKDTLILNYVYFKHLASINSYHLISVQIINNIDYILCTNKTFTVSVDMKGLTIGDVDKHKSFIQSISTLLKNRYPDKLNKCYIYNAPFVFSQIYSFVSLFIDKDTQNKIEIVSN